MAIDLRAGLGAPPIAFPGVRMQHHPQLPNVTTGAPTITPGEVAQRANLGCAPSVNSPVSLAGPGIGSLQTTWDKIPLWAKIAAGAAAFSGVSYGVYRLVR